MSDELRMKDFPMLDTDRERMREEFEDFDNMTMAEWQAASKKRMDELLDLFNRLGGGGAS
jgi:hypothetical protein